MVVEKSLVAVPKGNSSDAVASAKKKADRESARVANALARQRSQYLILKLQSGFRGFNARKNVWTLKNGGRPLNEKDMTDGLGQLGRSPSSTLGRNPTFMSFTIRFQKINDVSLLAKYPLLTTVDITQNHIPTLEALSVMPYLWKVSAGHNAITKAIDFAARPPEYSSEGDEYIGSSLRYLDLEYNLVDRLEERMGRHPLLTDLNLSNNKLTGNLNALRPLQMLRKLDVSFNALTSDWGLAGLPIETLSLADNQLTVLEETGELSRLVDLNIQNNKVSSLHGLRSCAKLLSLDVRCNLIEDIDELCHLKEVQALQADENPMFVPGRLMTGDEFRLHVVARLQSLVKLDGRVVTTEDKVRAVNALDFPGHEREERKSTWQRAFDPTGKEAVARRAEKVAHDRQSLVDLEFKDHLPAMTPIGSMKGKGAPVQQTGNGSARSAIGDVDGEVGVEEKMIGSTVGQRVSIVSRSRGGSIENAGGGRKGGREDLVARGLSELKHFAVMGTKPQGAHVPFPSSLQVQPFESVLEIEILDAVTGDIISGALVSLHPGSGPVSPEVDLLPYSQASAAPNPGLGKSPSLPASGEAWSPPAVVVNRTSDTHGLCEVRVDADTLKEPVSEGANFLNGGGDDSDVGEGDDEGDDHGDDGSLMSSSQSESSQTDMSKNSSGKKKKKKKKASSVPCQCVIKVPGYACFDGPLDGVQWPLSAGLIGGHRKRTTVKLMPLLGKPVVEVPPQSAQHEHSSTKKARSSHGSHHHFRGGATHDHDKAEKSAALVVSSQTKKDPQNSWHPTGAVIKVVVNVPSKLIRSAAGGILDITIPPGAFTSQGRLGTTYVGLARILVTASFYDPSTLPGDPKLFSLNSNNNNPIHSNRSGANELLVGRVGFSIEAFSTMGETLELRMGVGIDVSLAVDTPLTPQLAIKGSALSSIPRFARFDKEKGVWCSDDDGRSTLALLVHSDGSRLKLPSTSSLPSLPNPSSSNNNNLNMKAHQTKNRKYLQCEAPGNGMVKHCRDLVVQRLPFAFVGNDEIIELENLVCGLLPKTLLEWTNSDGDFSRDAAAISTSVHKICGSFQYLRRHSHRAVVMELKKKLSTMVKEAREALATAASVASLATATASLNKEGHGEGGASVVAAFRAKYKATKLQADAKAKEVAAAAAALSLDKKSRSGLKRETVEELDLSIWDETATPSCVELDHALASVMQNTFEQWPAPSSNSNLTANTLGQPKLERTNSFDSYATFNTGPLEDTNDDVFFGTEDNTIPTLKAVISQAADQIASKPIFSSLIRTKALTVVCPELNKGAALGLLVAHDGDVSRAALKAREVSSPAEGVVGKARGSVATDVLAPTTRHNKLKAGVRLKVSENPLICRAPIAESEIDAALVKAVSSNNVGNSNTPGWAQDNNAILSASNELSTGPIFLLRHAVALKCIAWPHLPGTFAATSSKHESAFASRVCLGVGDQLGLWNGAEVIAAVNKTMHGKGRKSDPGSTKKEDKKSKARDSVMNDSSNGNDAMIEAVWTELLSLEHIRPLIALYNSSAFAKSVAKAISSRTGSPPDADEANGGGKVELPLPEDIRSLAQLHPHATPPSSALSLFGPQQDDQTQMKEEPVSSSNLGSLDALSLQSKSEEMKEEESDSGMQGASDVVGSLMRMMSTTWLREETPKQPLIQADQFMKDVYQNSEPSDIASKAVSTWQASPHQKVASRLAKLRASVFSTLDIRGFPRVSEEFSIGGNGFHSIEALGPAECNAVLETCKHDVVAAAEILLSSPAFLRRCLLLEVKLRAQDSLCATALGPAASCAAELNKNPDGSNNGLSNAESKHFIWIESILRRHPHVSISMYEVTKAVEWATETVEALEREEQNINPRHENSMHENELNSPSGAQAGGGGGGTGTDSFPNNLATNGGGGESMNEEQIDLPTLHQNKHHKHRSSRKGSSSKKSQMSSVVSPSPHEESTIHRVNPIKAAALRNEAIAVRAVESICGNGTIVVRHRMAVETSQWSSVQVLENLGTVIDDEGELVEKGDSRFTDIVTAETAARLPDDFPDEDAPPVSSTPPTKGKGGKADAKADAKGSNASPPLSPTSPKDSSAPTLLHLDNPVTGGRLPEVPAKVFTVDISRVPILFKRSEIRSTVASFKGRTGADSSLLSLHASAKAVQMLHGPNHFRRLGLNGALPLSIAECERALSITLGELGPALDVLCFDPAIIHRYEVWRVRARINEALTPAAAANFMASQHVGIHAVNNALKNVNVAVTDAIANMDPPDATPSPVAVVPVPVPASPVKETKASSGKGGKAAKGGKPAPLKGNASVRMSIVSPVEEQETLDPELAELLAIGEFPTLPEFTVVCPKLAEETAKQQKNKKKGRSPQVPKPDNSRRPSMASQQGEGNANEADTEAMAYARFEAICLVYNRSRKLADRAANDMLVPPTPKNYVFNPITAPSQHQQNNGGRLNIDVNLPAIAADGRVGMVGSLIPSTPWMHEARHAVVHATAVLLAKLDRYLPADTNTVLEDLFNKGRPVLDEFGVANVPLVEEEADGTEVEAAMFDLAGLLPCSILDEVITRAVLREAAQIHTVKAAEAPPPTLEEGDEGAGDDKAAKGGAKGDDKSKEKAKKPPAGDKGKKAVKKEKGAKDSEESLFPYPVPPPPRRSAPPIPSKVPPPPLPEGETGDGGGADLMRWRYVVYEAVRSLIQDDVLFLRQWASRRLQRHLAPRFPFTILEESQLQSALDMCGGHVLKAAKLMEMSHKVNAGCWKDSGKALQDFLCTISGGGDGDSFVAIKRNSFAIEDEDDHGHEDDAIDAPPVLKNDLSEDQQQGILALTNGEETVPPAPSSAGQGTPNRGPIRSGSGGGGGGRQVASSSSHRHRPHHHHEFTWSVEELLTAADKGTAFVTGNRMFRSPMRRYIQDFLDRAAWLSKIIGLNITETETLNALLEASAGVKSKCILAEPTNPDIERQKEAELEAMQNSPAARLMKREESNSSSPKSSPFNLVTDDSKGHTPQQALQEAMLHIHPAVAFERLYTLPQVLAATAVPTRGLISYQRKLDLARILSATELFHPPPTANQIAQAASSSSVSASPYGEKFECTVDRLGWWCIGASPSQPAIIRGRLLFGVGVPDLLGVQQGKMPNEHIRGGSFSSNSSHSSHSTVSNATPRQLNGGKTSGAVGRNSTGGAFFTNSRSFFNPSLDVPPLHVDHSLVARAKQLANALSVTCLVKMNEESSEWVSPKASVGVVDPGLDSVILGFSCNVIPGTDVYISVMVGPLSKESKPTRFGPFKVPLDGGDVNIGDLTFPHNALQQTNV